MKLDYQKIIPLRYHNVSFEADIEERIKKVVIESIQKKSSLYIYGTVGSGKTHLACALVKNLLDSSIEVRFYNTGDFVEKLREEFEIGFEREDNYPGLFREIMDFKGILVLDDIGAEKISDWVRERLYLIINKKYEDIIPIIFTSNCDMEIMSARLGDRVSSRIGQMAETIRLTSKDRRLIN